LDDDRQALCICECTVSEIFVIPYWSSRNAFNSSIGEI
jgi:hypothetical protein